MAVVRYIKGVKGKDTDMVKSSSLPGKDAQYFVFDIKVDIEIVAGDYEILEWDGAGKVLEVLAMTTISPSEDEGGVRETLTSDFYIRDNMIMVNTKDKLSKGTRILFTVLAGNK